MGKKKGKKTVFKKFDTTTSTPNKESSQSSSGYGFSNQSSTNQSENSWIDDTRMRKSRNSSGYGFSNQSSTNQSENSWIDDTRMRKSRNSGPRNEENRSRNFPSTNESVEGGNSMSKNSIQNGGFETPEKSLGYDGFEEDLREDNLNKKETHFSSIEANVGDSKNDLMDSKYLNANRKSPSGSYSIEKGGHSSVKGTPSDFGGNDRDSSNSWRDPKSSNPSFKNSRRSLSNAKGGNQSVNETLPRRYEEKVGDSSNYSTDSKNSNSLRNNRSFSNAKIFSRIDSEEKRNFSAYLISGEAENDHRVEEVEKNLFEIGEDYALAHCVAEDMNMGSGIAVEFRSRFKKVTDLLDQHAKTGGLAFLEIKGRFIYYLVTKSFSQGKPSYDTLWSSLCELRKHMKANKVKKLAMPRIGCGLDRLDWNFVWPMLKFLFRSEDSDILVCNFQPACTTPTTPLRKCKVVYYVKPISEIESDTVIIYFASTDGNITHTMEEIDKKFKIRNDFSKAQKVLGQTVRTQPIFPKNYILYGCFVKNKYDEPFNYKMFDECLQSIKRNSRKDAFYYIAFQKEEDEILNAKILTLMKFSLRDIEIYVCGCTGTEE